MYNTFPLLGHDDFHGNFQIKAVSVGIIFNKEHEIVLRSIISSSSDLLCRRFEIVSQAGRNL